MEEYGCYALDKYRDPRMQQLCARPGGADPATRECQDLIRLSEFLGFRAIYLGPLLSNIPGDQEFCKCDEQR